MNRERAATAFWKRVARLRDARFSTALVPDPAAPPLLLSPHLDDAVIDCWSVLAAAGSLEVANVFGLAPPPGTSTDWDSVLGEPDSHALLAKRRSEDEAALGLAGRRAHNLPFLELQYRRGKPFPAFSAIDSELAARVPRASRVLAPLTLGVIHPDHLLLRRYALALADQGHAVTLYADSPYCTQHGWPAWVTGAPAVQQLDVDAIWAPSFEGLPVKPGSGRAVRLDDEAAARKLEAMRRYTTQFPSLDRGPVGQLSNPEIHRYEVFWDL